MAIKTLKQNKIRVGSELSHFIESDFPVDVKECSGEWKYVENNELAAAVSGLTAKDRIGMTIQDIGKINHIPEAAINKIVKADRDVSLDEKPITLLHAFLDKQEGAVVVDKVIKQPVVNSQDKMVGVLSYAQDMVPYLKRADLYSLYSHYYQEQKAIQSFLTHVNISGFFLQIPLDIELLIVLNDDNQIEELAQKLNLSVNDVRAYQASIQDKLQMIDYAELVQRLQVPGVIEIAA